MQRSEFSKKYWIEIVQQSRIHLIVQKLWVNAETRVLEKWGPIFRPTQNNSFVNIRKYNSSVNWRKASDWTWTDENAF